MILVYLYHKSRIQDDITRRSTCTGSTLSLKIEEGKIADICVLDGQFNLEKTMIDGIWVKE